MRQIENDVKSNWDQIKKSKKLEEFDEDCPPSLLTGWTDDNPSLWEADNQFKPNLEKILVALCRRKKDYWDRITYLLFNRVAIENSKLEISQTNGKTGDSKIDTSQTHYEIKDLRAKSLCTLIYYIMTSDFEVAQFKKSEFDRILLSVYDSAQVQAQSKTNTMSIQPKPIEASVETTNKITMPLENMIQEMDKTISGSIDFPSSKSPSATS